MALLAESLVEEWLNRSRFFAIRGIKHGLAEIDLLAIRHEAETPVIGWHRGAGQFSPSHLHREAYRRYGAGLEQVAD